MLSRKIPKLKLGSKCKGDSDKDNKKLNTNTNSKSCESYNFSISKVNQLGKHMLNGIPVLSIFAFLGILGYAVGLHYPIEEIAYNLSGGLLFSDIAGDDNKAYAAENTDTSASLTVDDGKVKDTIFAANGEFAYATHKVTVQANNIKSYTLTLTSTGLSGPSSVNGANEATPANMDNAWGYAFVDTNVDPTTATYKTVNSSQNLTDGPAIDSNTHNVSGSKQLIFGAKFGTTAASGTYHAEATLSMVATPRVVTNYVVTVNCNSGSNCTSALNTNSDEESYTYIISSTTPTRSGYKFLGYNTTNTTTANTNYAPGKTVTLTAASPTLTLYAIWQEDGPSVTGFGGIRKMQDMTATVCSNVSAGTSGQLYDTRDNSIYSVGKLADGRCWMTQNLRIINKTITSADSNVSNSYTIPASAVWGKPTLQTRAVGPTEDPEIVAMYSRTEGAYYGGSEIYGAYYSWLTATAGTTADSSADAVYDICPKGWKLPTGDSSSGEFRKLYDAYPGASSTGGYASSNGAYGYWFGASSVAGGGSFFPAAGQVQGSEPTISDSSMGYYWSNKASYGNNSAYFLMFSKSNIWATYSGDAQTSWGHRYNGYSVRCIAKN